VADQQAGGRGGQGGAAPSPAAAKYAWPAKPVLLSTAVKRLDGPDKVTGRARYSYDINRPGMLYGRIVRSPHPHARVVSVDLSAAEKAPGVKAALAWKEPGAQVMYQGDPVAGVAADTEERARDATGVCRTYKRPTTRGRPRRHVALEGAPSRAVAGAKVRRELHDPDRGDRAATRARMKRTTAAAEQLDDDQTRR